MSINPDLCAVVHPGTSGIAGACVVQIPGVRCGITVHVPPVHHGGIVVKPGITTGTFTTGGR